MLSPGRGNLRQGGLKDGADLAGWRNGRKTSMSEESEHCHPRASSAKTRGFHTQLDEGPETP